MNKNKKIQKKKKGNTRKKTSNNVIAALALLFMFSSLFFNWIIYNNTSTVSKITGKATNHASVSLCIGSPPPYVTIIHPNGGEVLNGSVWVNATATAADFDEDINVTFSFNSFNNEIGMDTNYSDIYYNLSWDTTAVNDGNCNLKIFVRSYSNKSECGLAGTDSSDSYFSINNIDEEPSWENFKNSVTTNFTEFHDPLVLGDWIAIENATVGIPDVGIINFSGKTINFDDADLDSHLEINDNYIGLDVNLNALPCLNRGAIITLYNIRFVQPKIMKNDELCAPPECNIISYSDDILIFNVSNFNYNYSSAENTTLNLDLWDDEDTSIKYINQQINIYGNLTNGIDNSSVNGSSVFCNISFNTTGTHNLSNEMIFNDTSLLYRYNVSFSAVNEFEYIVYCNDTYHNLTKTKAGNITITNRAPVLISNMPNETWNKNTILTGRDLDDYFIDPDGEDLIYTSTYIPNIRVSIDNTTHIITYTPDRNFYGNRTVKFYANDPHGARAESNVVYLFVIDVPEPPPSPSVGGGGGGSTITCKELWECTDWGRCLPSGIQIRECEDLAKCGTEFNKPYLSRECEYFATCDDLIKNCHVMSDGSILCEEGIDCGGPCPPCPTCDDWIQNQGEEGIDCGGPCPPCPSCFDGVKNCQKLPEGVLLCEEGIDCGGPCPPCPSCFDGVKNCHSGSCEEGVDCGGPCPPCKEIHVPQMTERVLWPTSLSILLLIAGIIFILIRYRKYYQPFIAKLILKAMPFMLLFKKRKKESEKIMGRVDYLNSILTRLNQIENKIGKENTEILLKKLARLFREFTSHILKINYEFTFEELNKEIKSHDISTIHRIVIMDFFKKISDVSYKGERIKGKYLKELVKEARIIIKMVFSEIQDEQDIKAKEGYNKNKEQKENNESKLMINIYKDIINAKKSIKRKDLDNAKLAYLRIKENYNELSLKDKKKIYKKVVDLYNSLKEEHLEKVKEDES